MVASCVLIDEYITLSSPHPMKAKSIGLERSPKCGTSLTPGISAGLSQKENAKLHNIHFICASNKAPLMEMVVPLVQEFNALEREGIVVFNAFLQCKVIVVAPILNFLCDNPSGAEICSQLGATAVMYCRICTVDVSTGLQGIGNLRTKTDTVAQIALIKSLPTKKEQKQMQMQLGTSCKPNPMLELAVDVHQATPVEVLHTLVLGPYKYLLRSRMARFSP
ncbi:hypothetical protein EMCRGX_G026770 [Ephydatia muelleri]